jgi:hypothetical protein
MFLGGDRDTNKRVFELKMRNVNKSYWVKTETKKETISLVNRYIYIYIAKISFKKLINKEK